MARSASARRTDGTDVRPNLSRETPLHNDLRQRLVHQREFLDSAPTKYLLPPVGPIGQTRRELGTHRPELVEHGPSLAKDSKFGQSWPKFCPSSPRCGRCFPFGRKILLGLSGSTNVGRCWPRLHSLASGRRSHRCLGVEVSRRGPGTEFLCVGLLPKSAALVRKCRSVWRVLVSKKSCVRCWQTPRRIRRKWVDSRRNWTILGRFRPN